MSSGFYNTLRIIRANLQRQPALEIECRRLAAKYGKVGAIATLMTRLNVTLDAAAAAWQRWICPRSRVEGLFYFGRNGGTAARRDSVVGHVGKGWCAKWRRTVRSLDYEQQCYDETAAECFAIGAALVAGRA
jgi:hypothetical protein